MGTQDTVLPNYLAPHEQEYLPQAYQEYTLQELGQWVHLFAKRAMHRKDTEKKKKDLYDAQNYLNMMQDKLNSFKDPEK